ncbi:hypothetical protein SAMN04515692_10533 [Leifsonia sp. CL147]|nr:hypothetical protein SAMN04515694_10534 [Leifsonia sp. CL154]SFL46667.1 hypothetical protein SAMN04515692_10533 [Leifsonia sp. CL147]
MRPQLRRFAPLVGYVSFFGVLGVLGVFDAIAVMRGGIQ